MAQTLVLVLAERAGTPIASALLMREGSALYGRYWGSLEAVDCLHFETAYYTPLEWAIEHGITRFEGGAQGEHKLARGFLPVTTHSSHHVAHPAFADAIARHVARETAGLSLYVDELERHSPLAAPPSNPNPASP
jgi:predicted N-acyltransferase